MAATQDKAVPVAPTVPAIPAFIKRDQPAAFLLSNTMQLTIKKGNVELTLTPDDLRAMRDFTLLFDRATS